MLKPKPFWSYSNLPLKLNTVRSLSVTFFVPSFLIFTATVWFKTGNRKHNPKAHTKVLQPPYTLKKIALDSQLFSPPLFLLLPGFDQNHHRLNQKNKRTEAEYGQYIITQ
ncbi:hypothetical protein CIPAW_06G082500 [Carya illinoinensis]|uniref:Uncharacterized protein n=1 Tax=Carya illinoinensis TaxID=32201 RepID=A0A8T1Q9I2_CARIL|nr:hypothetical protein CIPAW_06G082500 [Carya illinoinensis]